MRKDNDHGAGRHGSSRRRRDRGSSCRDRWSGARCKAWVIHPVRATARCSAVARSSRAGPAPRPRSAESSRVDQLRPGRGHDDPDHAVTVKRTHLRFPFNPLLGVISSARPLTAAIGQALVGRVRPGANDRVNEPRSPALPAAARDALLNLVLDTDDGRGNRHQGVRRGWWILLLMDLLTL